MTEISNVLGIAFHNQQKVARRRRTRFDYLVSRGFLKEEELSSSWEEARKANEPMEDFLMKKFKISKENIGRSLENFFNCKFIEFSDKLPIPGGTVQEPQAGIPPAGALGTPRQAGGARSGSSIDDPNNLLKRDMIENLLKTKTIEYCVALKAGHHQSSSIISSMWKKMSPSINEILGKLDAVEEAEEEDDEMITESDSVIMQLVNKIINDAYTGRASDIHIEPNTRKKTLDIRFRIDGDCVNTRPCRTATGPQPSPGSRSCPTSTSPNGGCPGRENPVQEVRTATSSCASPPSHPGQRGGRRDAHPRQGRDDGPRRDGACRRRT